MTSDFALEVVWPQLRTTDVVGRPASGMALDGAVAVRPGVQGGGGSRNLFVPQVTTRRPAVLPQTLLS